MKLLFLVIVICSFIQIANCLAPHPLYFTVDGEPRETKVTVRGKGYTVIWTGKTLYMADDDVDVKCVFAYYDDPFFELPATASFLIKESNHSLLVVGGNVSAETLMKNGARVPPHPTYEEWVKMGRPIRRE